MLASIVKRYFCSLIVSTTIILIWLFSISNFGISKSNSNGSLNPCANANLQAACSGVVSVSIFDFAPYAILSITLFVSIAWSLQELVFLLLNKKLGFGKVDAIKNTKNFVIVAISMLFISLFILEIYIVFSNMNSIPMVINDYILFFKYLFNSKF